MKCNLRKDCSVVFCTVEMLYVFDDGWLFGILEEMKNQIRLFSDRIEIGEDSRIAVRKFLHCFQANTVMASLFLKRLMIFIM